MQAQIFFYLVVFYGILTPTGYVKPKPIFIHIKINRSANEFQRILEFYYLDTCFGGRGSLLKRLTISETCRDNKTLKYHIDRGAVSVFYTSSRQGCI